ncbi:hypothetical protein MTO96_002674 [Rhipicephalus appendiculatus]
MLKPLGPLAPVVHVTKDVGSDCSLADDRKRSEYKKNEQALLEGTVAEAFLAVEGLTRPQIIASEALRKEQVHLLALGSLTSGCVAWYDRQSRTLSRT